MPDLEDTYIKIHDGTAEYKTIELEGPYECPRCCGCVMLDVFFVEDQPERKVRCPYCNKVILVPE